MHKFKNIIFFFLIAGGVFYLVVYVPPVRDRAMQLFHSPNVSVKGASTVRNEMLSSVSGQIQSGVNKQIQSAQKQLLNIKVSDILSQLQKAGVNVQNFQKLVQPTTPTQTPTPTAHK